MVENVFLIVGAILGLAAIGGVLAQLLRQPLIVAFIAVGMLLGPSGFGVVAQRSEVELFARLGIALLLFVVGLKPDLHIIRTVGPVALVTGLGQVIFTWAVGFLIALLLGMPPIAAIYVAVALTFSSTIIVVKLLSDKREVSASVARHARDGYAVHYGAAEDPEFIATQPLSRASWLVSTVRDRTINRMLLHGLRQQGYRGQAALSTSSRHDARAFEQEGVDSC